MSEVERLMKILGRLKIELLELVDKYDKLDAFLESDYEDIVSKRHADLMIDQHFSMMNYKHFLSSRIELIEEEINNL